MSTERTRTERGQARRWILVLLGLFSVACYAAAFWVLFPSFWVRVIVGILSLFASLLVLLIVARIAAEAKRRDSERAWRKTLGNVLLALFGLLLFGFGLFQMRKAKKANRKK